MSSAAINSVLFYHVVDGSCRVNRIVGRGV